MKLILLYKYKYVPRAYDYLNPDLWLTKSCCYCESNTESSLKAEKEFWNGKRFGWEFQSKIQNKQNIQKIALTD